MSTSQPHTPLQETTDTAMSEPVSTVTPPWYKRPPIIATIAVALIAVLVVVGVVWKTHTDTLSAREEYQAAQATYQQTLTELDQTKTQAKALIDLVAQRALDTDTTALAVAVEEADALSSVEAQDASALGREQAKEATRTVKDSQGEAQSVLDKLTASFTGVREHVTTKATTTFDQGIKTLNEAIEAAGMANRNGVDQALTDQLDTALKDAQALDQAKPETLETVADIEAVFTRADQAGTVAKTLSDATTTVNDAATAYAQTQQAQSTGGYNEGNGGGYSASTYSNSNAGGNGGGGYSGGSGDVCGGGPYCYNPNFPEWIQATDDGSWHHQVQPDENGTVTGDIQGEVCVGTCD